MALKISKESVKATPGIIDPSAKLGNITASAVFGFVEHQGGESSL